MDEITLLEQAKQGHYPQGDDRLHLLLHLETSTDMTRSEMATLLGVSERHVYRLLIKARKRLQEAIDSESLIGRMCAAFERSKTGILTEIRSLESGKKWRLWKVLWDMERDFAQSISALSLEKRIEELEDLIDHASQNGISPSEN